jgi:hypothetical protein
MDSDMLHPAGKDREWNESLYFNLYDGENDLCMFMRIGLKPNMDERSAFCFIMMPDGSLVGMKDQEPQADGGLDVRSLRFERVEAEKRWRLTFDGRMARMAGPRPEPVPVSFDLEFESLNPMFDYRECVDAESERLSQRVASEHLEQFGRATGSLKVGEQGFEISGLGERDHSWGVRDWNAPKMWIWLTAEFSTDLAFNVTKLYVEGGDVSAGFVFRDGRNLPVVKADIETVLDADGTPRSLTIKLQDKYGGKHHATAEVLREALMPFPSRDGKSISIMHETLAEYRFAGKKGYGIAEYLVRKS